MKKPEKARATKPKILPENSLEKALVSKAKWMHAIAWKWPTVLFSEDRNYIASQLLDKALLSAPDNAGVVMAYGRFQLFRGEPEPALGTFQRAIQLEPKLFTANFFIGKTLAQLSMVDDARHAFRSALAQNKEHVPSLLALATIQEGKGHRKRAIELLKRALALKPGAMVLSRRLVELVDKAEGPDGLFKLLGDRNCNMAYRTLHVMVTHLLTTGDYFDKPWYRRNIRCYIHYLETAGITDKQEVKEIIEHSFISNLYYPKYQWRERALSHCTTATFKKWVTVEGLELYREAEAQGKGVILVTAHFVPGWVALQALDRHGIETTSVAFRDALGEMNIRLRNPQEILTRDGDSNVQWIQSQTAGALKKGGTVLVSGDTRMKGEAIELPFLGRERGFKPGFATLAVTTGAPILPMFTSMDRDGYITVHIQPELKQRPGLARKARIKDLVVKFVERLERHWKAHPGNLPWLYVYHALLQG